MATYTHETTEEEDAAIAEAAAQQGVTAAAYFAERARHWINPLVQAKRARTREVVSSLYEHVSVHGTAQEKAAIEAMRQKYAGGGQ